MLCAMNREHGFTRCAALAAALLFGGPAAAAVYMDGEVTLDYYVAEVDADGFEFTDVDLYAQRVVNDGAQRSGPLSLSGWLTGTASPAGDGTEIGYAPIGTIPAFSSLHDVAATAPADDATPGEYYTHVLLQDDDFPGTYEDARTLSPRLLWRGGLEAAGPLTVEAYGGGTDVAVDFAQLRNNRIDSRYTNDILLRLYATAAFGPAADGYVLCDRTVPGLYAGDWRNAPGFDCALRVIPDGDYTVHLMVAELGGRGGSSTLTGPDLRFRNGRAGGYGHDVYVAGSTGLPTSIALLLAALAAWRRRLRLCAAAPG
jgi:hypothetical protein